MTDATKRLIKKVEETLVSLRYNEDTTTPDICSRIYATLANEAAYAHGDSCPMCAVPMQYDEGEPQTHWEPGVEASIYCDECGDAYPVDWQRKEMEGFYEAEFVDPKDDGELTDAERNA